MTDQEALRRWLRVALLQGRRIERLGELVTKGEMTPEQAFEELLKPVPLEGPGQILRYKGTIVARMR